MRYLLILNDPPYGTERSYNGLRLALTLQKREDVQLSIFLMADAVLCAKRGQKTPDGYYNLERMLKGLGSRHAAIGTCASCMDARGLTDEELLPGVHRSSMEELTDWTVAADKVMVF
jgi:uncharacterized protein involved in oxidation of intracellular sulfur